MASSTRTVKSLDVVLPSGDANSDESVDSARPRATSEKIAMGRKQQ